MIIHLIIATFIISVSQVHAIAEPSVFTDKIPDWAREAILELHEDHVIRGYDDGRFGASDSVTQGQYLTMLYRMLINEGYLPEENSDCNLDFSKNHYAYQSTCRLLNSGLIDTFFPDVLSESDKLGWDLVLLDAPAKRIEIAIYNFTMLERSLPSYAPRTSIFEPLEKIFNDIELDTSEYFITDQATQDGIMTGYPDKSFRPNGILNRAEAAIIIHRLKKTILKKHPEKWNFSNPVSSPPDLKMKADADDSKRRFDISLISKSIYLYILDTKKPLPECISNESKNICTTSSNCMGVQNGCSLDELANSYFVNISVDPDGPVGNDTLYDVWLESDGKLTVAAPETIGEKNMSITRSLETGEEY
ncbi:S-layer homology domain-containing protein [Candidatus Peregrinibacteria bacterium]|jgi:hypothetical protein|nr:S-layer homology domain-containing protein [Candidatus Peregrinibacteria bacterium]MBT7337815.1 S-layer homology domain-containing protein [Candidatus Peregrinibacteria bacterium]